MFGGVFFQQTVGIHMGSNCVLFVVITIRYFLHSRSITGFVTGETRRMPLVFQELLTLSEAPEFIDFCGIVAKSLVFYVFCRSLFVLLSFSFNQYTFSTFKSFLDFIKIQYILIWSIPVTEL